MEWNAAPISLTTLPQLGQSQTDPHQNYYSLPSVGPIQTTLTELVKSISKRSIWSDVDLALFPNAKRLDYCVDCYFLHFDKV